MSNEMLVLVVALVGAVVAVGALLSKSFRCFVFGALLGAFVAWLGTFIFIGGLAAIAYVCGFIAMWIGFAVAYKTL